MPADLHLSTSNGTALLVSAGIVYEIIAAACSSPQTTEINADTRSETLMKWVHVGVGQSAVFIVLAASIDKPHRREILLGGTLAAAMMYASYWHARESGLRNPGPSTESRKGPWTR